MSVFGVTQATGCRRAVEIHPEVPLARVSSGGGQRLGVEGEERRTLLRAGLGRRRPGIRCAEAGDTF